MNAYRAYHQPLLAGMTRVDMLLALYDKLLGRLEAAQEALAQGQTDTANSLLVRAEVLVTGLTAGVDASRGELAINFLRLYDFALRSFRQRTPEGVTGALRALHPLHERWLPSDQKLCGANKKAKSRLWPPPSECSRRADPPAHGLQRRCSPHKMARRRKLAYLDGAILPSSPRPALQTGLTILSVPCVAVPPMLTERFPGRAGKHGGRLTL